MDAFVFNEDDTQKRVHVFEVCMGRESLAFAQSRARPGLSEGRLLGSSSLRSSNTSIVWLASFERRVRELGTRLHSLKSAYRRLNGSVAATPASSSMKETLDNLEAEEAALQQQLRADKAKWSQECDELAEEERQLGDEYAAGHMDRQAQSEAAEAQVKGEFCPVVQSNYGINEDKIRDHVQNECA